MRGQCEMLCSHPPPHSSLTHAHSSSGGQVPSSATAKASANRRRGGGGGGGGAPPEQDGQSVDEYQGPHEGVCVCVHACVCACVMSKKVDTLSSYSTPLGSVCHVRLVPATMSCTVCLCRRSQLVTRPGLSPVLPAPAVSAHLWCQHLPLQRQPQICGLT